ncbi:MAG: methylenetetrahydrofolate reductase [Acidobacteria bacterium]|nr:methylenetetrahydrofolate reductase [Acidobacteriota bacterium]MBU4307521.1 methylenetetrahydrofolate reductase [Acidobacteriota bacterium]MBU4404307.1 methylenetetrahydrofolate reductase [Acidobacteriota bacterium]MCG2810904.1 methylenetetrahydrofolate reductase [Candidatus Aminicenantes bacterium]
MAKVIDWLKQNDKLMFSLEITPPDRGKSVDDILSSIETMMPFDPQFINVTYHQPHVVYEEKAGVISRRPRRKKPGTVGICSAIRNRFRVEPVPHLICGGFDHFETEDALIDLNFLGIENILALRGDPPPGQPRYIPEKNGHQYAWQLVEQIAQLNRGQYIDELEDPFPTNFCIGVAAYPEKHFESPNLEKDLFYLKKKVDMGAEYIITQMFYDFRQYRTFVEKARAIGIQVPIIPGLKPLVSKKQITTIPSSFHVNIPAELVASIEEARSREQEFANGVRFLARLAEQLIDYGVPGIHVFSMGQGRAAKAFLETVFAGKR